MYKRQESTFANHLIEANHTYKNIDNNMNILQVHTKARKLDTLEQLEIYKHTKTNKNDILNEQTQFKLHALFEDITPHTHNRFSKIYFVTNNKTDSGTSGNLWRSFLKVKTGSGYKVKLLLF